MELQETSMKMYKSHYYEDIGAISMKIQELSIMQYEDVGTKQDPSIKTTYYSKALRVQGAKSRETLGAKDEGIGAIRIVKNSLRMQIQV